jgi:hypothetical protein
MSQKPSAPSSRGRAATRGKVRAGRYQTDPGDETERRERRAQRHVASDETAALNANASSCFITSFL